MRKQKKMLKAIPRFTPFEKDKALEVRQLIEKNNIDPMTITNVGIGGDFRFCYDNIAHYFELTGTPFNLVQSNFHLVKKGGKYERRQNLT